MMHGGEKSDLAIVAAKPANNDGQPSAELVERRAGAEGNAGQDRTRRAQDRANVSKGLDRVRHVCCQTPKVGAECPNWARSDLCGGRSVMGVPTAIKSAFQIPICSGSRGSPTWFGRTAGGWVRSARKAAACATSHSRAVTGRCGGRGRWAGSAVFL